MPEMPLASRIVSDGRAVYASSALPPRLPSPAPLDALATNLWHFGAAEPLGAPWSPEGGPRPPPYNRTRTVFPVPRKKARGWPSIAVKRLCLALEKLRQLRAKESHTFHRHLEL